MRLDTGSRLGPYEITGRIGAGGMGEVYRARDTRLGREVAIKVLPGDVSRDSARVARFKREACSASALNHRNIVTVHDFTSSEDEAWLVMELIRGQSVREALAAGALSMKRIIAIGTGIADGLAAAHAAGIIHRDLKPENVMITSDGTAKILDFGLVKQAMSESDTKSPTDMVVSRAGVILGTAAYMSPEQARAGDVDFRTDHFSLGVMLQEMATGKHPFARPSGVETLAAILNDEPQPLGGEFPEPFVAIVERCLAKSPQDRYGSTADLAHDLRRLGSRPDRVSSVTLPRGGKRNWWPLAAAALLIALAGAVAAWLRKTTPATDTFDVSVATTELAHVVRDEIALPVALSPDGRWLVVYGINEDGLPALWLHDLRSGSKRQLTTNAYSIGWSPDSKSIAYFGEGKLKVIPLQGGPPRVVCDARPESIPSWRGENILYAQYSTKEPGVYVVSAEGGSPRRIAGPDPKRPGSLPFWPQFLPDGKHYLSLLLLQEGMQKGMIEHELYLASIDGSAPKRVLGAIDSRAVYANGSLLFVRDGALLAQPFDIDGARFTGEAKPIVEGLHYFRSTGLAAFSVSDTGVLAFRRAQEPSRLVWFDRTGTELKTLATSVFHADGRLSPDGKRLAIGVVDVKQGLSDIWVYDLDRESSERVTFSSLDEKAPVWAHDGRSIYYRGDGNGPPDIFLLKPGAEAGEPVYRGPAVEEPQDMAPDGQSMLFLERMQVHGVEDVYVLGLNRSGAPRPLIATPFDESSPRFSPDGRWVAYQSDISGKPEVYVRPFESGGSSVRISRDGGVLPRWRADGSELFFLAPGGRLMSAAMQNGAATAVARTLFQVADAIDFEPAPDGARFLVQLQPTAEPPVRLLINWPQRTR